MATTTDSSLIDQPNPRSVGNVFRLAWQALMLQDEVYQPLISNERSFRRGLRFLALLLTPVALATSLGLLLDYLTMPRLGEIQTQVYGLVTGLRFVQDFFSQAPYLVSLVSFLYNLLWLIIRLLGNYPSPTHMIVVFFIVLRSNGTRLRTELVVGL
jgi:hypothetical protein